MKIEDYITDPQIFQYLHYMNNAAPSLILIVRTSMNEYNRQYHAKWNAKMMIVSIANLLHKLY